MSARTALTLREFKMSLYPILQDIHSNRRVQRNQSSLTPFIYPCRADLVPRERVYDAILLSTQDTLCKPIIDSTPNRV
jgi:hypothetical protein